MVLPADVAGSRGKQRMLRPWRCLNLAWLEPEKTLLGVWMCTLELSRQNSLLRQLLGKGSRCPQQVEGFSEGPQWQEGYPGVLGAGDGAGRLGTPRRISRSVVSRAGEAVERRQSAPVAFHSAPAPRSRRGLRGCLPRSGFGQISAPGEAGGANPGDGALQCRGLLCQQPRGPAAGTILPGGDTA